jgi:lactate permease
MVWTQSHDPFGSLFLSTLLAAVPIVLLLGLLATGRVSAPAAALIGLVAAFLIAVFAYVPDTESIPGYGERVWAWLPSMTAAMLNGVAFGLFPIGWIVLNAIFLYTMTVETGHFEIVKHSVASLSDDRRIQALLIAFCFGAFVEGAAGFGTPVAISAALMMGAGFKPLYAAGLALIANTSPVAFGALGTPTIMLQRVTDLPLDKLSAMAGRQLPIFSLIVPVWLVWTMSGWRATVAIWPALLVCGGSFALVQFLTANYHGPWLVDVLGGLISLIGLALFLRVWKPSQNWHFPDEPPPTPPQSPPSQGGARRGYTTRELITAWVPWLLLTVLVFLWGIPAVKNVLGEGTTVKIEVPELHKQIARDKPVVSAYKIEEAVYDFNWLNATGTGIFLAAVLSAAWLRVGPGRFVRLFALTCYRMRWPLFTIACMLGIAFTTRYSGMDATLGVMFTKTGWIYPLFAALLGWLGVALTGSDTSSNALFGSLQKITAEGLADPGPLPLTKEQAAILLTTANSTGGVMGKMIDAQSIVVSAAATQQYGQEGAILRFVFFHSLVLALLMGLLVLAQAYFLSWMIP